MSIISLHNRRETRDVWLALFINSLVYSLLPLCASPSERGCPKGGGVLLPLRVIARHEAIQETHFQKMTLAT